MNATREELDWVKQNKAKMANCRGCRHLATTQGGTYWICEYLEDTGHIRPCQIETCTVKELKERRRRRLHPFHLKTMVLALVMLAAMALTIWLAPPDAEALSVPETVAERDADAECIAARAAALKRRAGEAVPRKNLPVVTEIRVYLGRYWITGYDICLSCCGKTDGITASGVKATVGRTVAAPPGFAFGTRLYIDGLGERVVEDRGGAIRGNKIDVLCNDHPECFAITGWYDVYEIVEG